MNIVESLSDGKRIPVYAQEKVVALSDVSIYTKTGDVPLREVLKTIKEKEGGKQLSLGSKSSSKELFAYFGEVLPDYSRDSVYAGDVKKLISWYNILTEHNIDLEKAEKTEENSSDEIQNLEGEE